MHARCAIFLKMFNYVFNYKPRSQNQAADALSHHSLLFAALHTELIRFDHFKDQYSIDPNFHEIWHKCSIHDVVADYLIQSGFLFKGNQFCVPQGSLRLHLIQEHHGNGLSAHLGKDKTILQLEDRFYWPHMRRNITKFVT